MHRLFEGAGAELLVEVAALTQEGGWRRRYLSPANFAKAHDKLRGKRDVFFGPALRKRRGPTKEDVDSSRVAWVDYDNLEYPDPTPILPPTYRIRTGKGWHLYWLLSTYVKPSRLEFLNRVLVEAIGGKADISAWNCNRILRLPGTLYRGTGRVVSVEEVFPVSYRPDDIAALEHVEGNLLQKLRVGGRGRGYRSRSERDYAVVASLLSLGFSSEAVKAIYDTQPIGDKYHEHGDPTYYLERTINAAKKKAESGTGGLLLKEKCYYVRRGKEIRKVSTFQFDPKLLLEAEREDSLLGNITCEGSDHVWEDVTLSRSAFTSARALLKELPKAGWQWLGSDTDARALLPLLVKKLQDAGMPRVRAVTCAGRHGEFFVTPSGTISVDNYWPHPTGPLVYLNFRGATVEVPDLNLAVPAVSPPACAVLRSLLEKVTNTNVPKVMYPMLGWWLATPLKTVIEEAGWRFPMLDVFGTRGSGKTSTIIDVLQRLYSYRHRVTFDSGTTRFVLLSLLGATNALPVALSEFRQAVGAEQLIRYVLLSYDVGHDPRGRPDRTVEDFPLTSPFSVDGEDLMAEPAGRERMIGVRLRPEYIEGDNEHVQEFRWLQDRPGWLERFALPYLQYTLTVNATSLLIEAEKLMWEAFPESLPNRVRKNFGVVLVGLLAARDFVGLDLPPLRETLFESLSFSFHPQLGRGRLHIDEFVEALVGAVDRKTSSFFWEYDPVENVLWFQLSPTLAWWRKECRRWGSSSLGREAIASQMEEVNYARQDTINDRWCYGIQLEKAAKSGLDIPARLDTATITINL